MNITINTVKDYIQAIADMRDTEGFARPWPEGWRYSGPEQILLAYGRAWSAPDKKYRLPKGVKWGPVKACYFNAYKLALRRPDLTYVEGYAGRIIPCSHAWCVDEIGTVIDNTWRMLPGCPDGGDYFGVPIRTDYLKAVLGKNPQTFGLLDNYETKWPLMSADPADWLDSRWCATCGPHKDGVTFPHHDVPTFHKERA